MMSCVQCFVSAVAYVGDALVLQYVQHVLWQLSMSTAYAPLTNTCTKVHLTGKLTPQ